MVRILQQDGEYVIKTSQVSLDEMLLNVEYAGRVCYQSESENDIKTAENFVKMLVRRNHWSVVEHSLLTVHFNKISRGFTAEQNRHRLTSISESSTRYIDFTRGKIDLNNSSIGVIAPPGKNVDKSVDISYVKDGKEINDTISFREMASMIEGCYKGLRKNGWLPEEARQILPLGLQTQEVISTNWREWRHIMFMRTNKKAHWEIRELQCKLLSELMKMIPAVFDDFVLIGEDKRGIPYYELKD